MTKAESKPSLLVVEDDAAAMRQLRWTFDGYNVETAGDRPAAVALCEARRFPVVLLDLGLPPDPDGYSEGLQALSEIQSISPETKVVVVTGREERSCALRAIELGAYDYYQKPVDGPEIRILVDRAYGIWELEAENRRLARSASQEPLPGVISVSGLMKDVCAQVVRAARSDISVLFLGESGTGKEVLARALHELSDRREGPFIAINCAAIPESLLESELFGHEKGSFTGADKRVIGRFELAAGGTLLLDEIGDVPASIQVKLLRFLQERVIQRVGGRDDIPVDVRVVSATHRPVDPGAGGESTALREDLYYRIGELTLEVPPLRDRPEDAVVLAQHFVKLHAERESRPITGLTADATAAVAGHSWPGNVRELENRLKRAVVLAEGSRVTAGDLGLEAPRSDSAGTLRDAVQAAEREALARAWAAADGNLSKASRLLEVSRPTLYKLLREHGLRD